ncbi:hypothetical protein FBU30_009883 [Linnemannia zychae]|nr:hypothetical protein FBU30_009883 [Linnemannia zychae]
MAPSASHHDREKHRRLAITADTSSNGAISVKTPSRRAVRRVETHQSKAESTAELDNTSTTATKNNNNHVNNTNRADDRPKSSSFPNFKPTSTTVATLLPALQMEDEEELSAVSRHSQSAQDIATESRLKITSSPSRSPPLLPVALELSLQTINSPLVSSTHLESPRQSPFIPCSVLDDIQQDLNTSSEVTSNIPKGLTPPIQLPQETFANPSISMDRSYQATTIAKSSEIIPKSTSVVNIPSTFLSGTPLIFKAFRPAEVTTDPVPTTLHKNESTYPTSTSTSEGPVDLTLPTTQRNTPARTGLLASMGPNVSRTPLKRIKEPSVMLDMMMLVKERRASNSLCDATTFSNKNSVGTNNSSPVNVTQVSSAATANITFEDKKAYLKNQVAQRRNNRLKNRDLNKLDPLSIPDSSSGCFFQPSPLPSPASVDSLSVPAFPAVPVTIPLKAATVLHGMGYPINNAASIATSPFYPSRSSSPSPTWSAPSTPRMIPSSLSTTSLSSVSSISSSVSVVSSSSSWSSTSSSSKMSLPSSFPDRLFQTRSTSSSPVATLPRSFSPRTVRASSLTGVGERAGTLSSERQSCYIVQNSSNNNKPLFSAKLPSLPSPTLSLAVPERKFMSTRSIVDVDGYFRPRRQHFSGSRSEDEQPVASPTVGRYATLHPFEKEILQQQQQATEALHPSWSNDGSFKSSSVSPLVPSSCQDTSVGDKGMHRERVHERSMSATSIDFDKNGFLSQPHRHQKQQQQQQQQQHETYSQPSSPFLAAITTTSAAPTTQDISFLTKRLANLQLMDALCPVPVTPTTLNIATSTQHPSPQQQPSLQQSGAIDASWAMQIQLLLTHLAEQTDIEQECRPRPLPPPPRPASVILPQESNEEESDDRKNIRKKGMGLYKQVLTDWLFRLDQIATASLTATNSGLYRDHPGLKREIDKIRWQHNVPSRVVKTK